MKIKKLTENHSITEKVYKHTKNNRCPHCGKSLYATKEKLPVRLSPTHEEIIKFCKTPKRSFDIANHINVSMSALYKQLRILQRLDQLEKLQPENARGYNYDVKFVATNKPILWDADFMQMTDRPIVMGVRL